MLNTYIVPAPVRLAVRAAAVGGSWQWLAGTTNNRCLGRSLVLLHDEAAVGDHRPVSGSAQPSDPGGASEEQQVIDHVVLLVSSDRANNKYTAAISA